VSAKKGLGRSFDSLIPTELLDESFDPTSEQDDRVSDLRYIKLSEIAPDPNQPRRAFDEVSLDELAASVKEHGVLQPIVVAPDKQGYKIVAGERRFRASQRAGLEKIPALVRTLSSQHKLELSLIENLQRSDLNPLETATAYLKLRDQFNLTLEEIGQRVGGKTSAARILAKVLNCSQSPDQAPCGACSACTEIAKGSCLDVIEIDGASRWQRITKILIPLVRPTTLYLTVINIIAVLKIFVVIQLLTGGGPNNASVTMMYYLYQNAFVYNNRGVAAAVGVLMFIFAVLLSIPQFKAFGDKK